MAAILSASLLPLISSDGGTWDEQPTEQQEQQRPLQPPLGVMDLGELTTAHEQVLLLTLHVMHCVDAVDLLRF